MRQFLPHALQCHPLTSVGGLPPEEKNKKVISQHFLRRKYRVIPNFGVGSGDRSLIQAQHQSDMVGI
jgi:hypothetical protein